MTENGTNGHTACTPDRHGLTSALCVNEDGTPIKGDFERAFILFTCLNCGYQYRSRKAYRAVGDKKLSEEGSP